MSSGRTRLNAEYFQVFPPDENHSGWVLYFTDKYMESDVFITIEDVKKLKKALEG